MTERPPLTRTRDGSQEPDRSITLASLADRVRRLAPSHRDPEAFHVEKSEIESELRRIANGGRHG